MSDVDAVVVGAGLAGLAALALAGRAQADSLNFTLQSPTQQVSANGGTLSFIATLFAPSSNTAPIYLNGFGYNVAAPLTLDGAAFNNTPYYLSPGDSYSSELFTVNAPSGTAVGDYAGTYTLYGGADSSSYDPIGTQSFVVHVTPAPEPSTWALMILGFGMAGCTLRRRRVTLAIA